jgi:hypothetical protein
MTQRVGVKTTLTMERAFSGFPVPSGNPTFFAADRSPIRLLLCSAVPVPQFQHSIVEVIDVQELDKQSGRVHVDRLLA